MTDASFFRNNLIEDDVQDTLLRVSKALKAIGMAMEDGGVKSSEELEGFGLLIMGGCDAVDYSRKELESFRKDVEVGHA